MQRHLRTSVVLHTQRVSFDKHMPPYNLYIIYTAHNTHSHAYTHVYTVHTRSAHIDSKSNYPFGNVKCAEYFFYPTGNGGGVVPVYDSSILFEHSLSISIHLIHSIHISILYWSIYIYFVVAWDILFIRFVKIIEADRGFLSLSLSFADSFSVVRFLCVIVDIIRWCIHLRRSKYAFRKR